MSSGIKVTWIFQTQALPCFQELKHVDGKKEEFGVMFVLKFSWLNPHLKALLLPKSESVCSRSLKNMMCSVVALGQDIETDIHLMDGSKLTGKITQPAPYHIPDALSAWSQSNRGG